jgi:hypothetical protein
MTEWSTTMLAEIFILRLQAMLRTPASNGSFAGRNPRFVPIARTRT